jgi:hypothetical protein
MHVTDGLTRLPLLLSVCALSLLSLGSGARAQVEGAPIAGPPVTPAVPAPGKIADAYEQLVPGLLARTRYVSEGAGPVRVEVLDLMVGPGKTSDKKSFAGTMVVEVRSGRGAISWSGKSLKLTIGATFAVPEGAELVIANGDDQAPLILRVALIRAVDR